ncbi:MAG: helix-turn-helix transcriptional regulator [Clostridia bacterium]|nr:helix-turn-helix transcriptional regulator [Clostridia bacterium]
MKKHDNIYRNARMRAAQDEPLYSSRERAAEALFVSVDALSDYENGRTLPPCDVVQRMVEAYGDRELKRQHIRDNCPLLTDYGGASACCITQAALRWAIEATDMREMALRFARLASDGKITGGELEAVGLVKEKAVALRRVMDDSIAAIEDAVKEVTK